MNYPETSRFVLKEIVQQDIHHVYRGLSNPKVTKHYAVHFPTLEASREQMEWYAGFREKR